MDPVTAGILASASVVGGIMNLFGQHSANRTNVALTRETNALNAQMHSEDIATQYNLQQREMDFNSPTTQANLMRAAGLNPANMGLSQGSVGSASVPSAKGMVAPTVSNELSGLSQVPNDIANNLVQLSEMSKNSNEATGQALNNTWAASTLDNRIKTTALALDKAEQDIANSKEDTELKKRQQGFVDEQKRGLQLSNDLVEETYGDMLMRTSIQNDLMMAQAQQAREGANLAHEQALTQSFNRWLGEQANDRANKVAVAQIAQLYASAWQARQAGNLSERQILELKETFQTRLNKLSNENHYINDLRLNILAQNRDLERRGSVYESQKEVNKAAAHVNEARANDIENWSWLDHISNAVGDAAYAVGQVSNAFKPGFTFSSGNTPPPSNNPSPVSFDSHVPAPDQPRRTMSLDEYIQWKRSTDPSYVPTNPALK